MKKFQFPLRSVATIRGLRETRAREGFAAAVQAHTAAGEQVRQTELRIQELETVIRRERRESGFQAADQVSFLRACQRENAALQQASARLSEARAEMERCRQVWLDARRDVRLLGILEEKARAEHRRLLEHEQQALLDDRGNAQTAAGHRSVFAASP